MSASSGLAGEVSEKKPAASVTETGKGEKDTSLYLYYQKYLSPYLGNPRTTATERYKEPGQKGVPASQAPSGKLLSNRSKLNEAGAGSEETASGQKDPAQAQEKTYFSLNKLDSVGLEEINRSFPGAYRKEYLAELAFGIKLSPLLDLSFGKVQKFERYGGSAAGNHDESWKIKDDGWRLRLQKNF
jgi:hypothetical protein